MYTLNDGKHGMKELPDASGYVQELRREIDRLRLENQRLYVELGEARAWPTVLTRLRKFVRRAVRRVRLDVVSIFAGSNSTKNKLAPHKFTPHHVRVRRPVEDGRPRIVHVIANFYTGGSSQLVVDLIERLGHRFEQAIIARDLPGEPAYTGIQLEHVERLTSAEEAYAYLRSLRPRFLHVHFLGSHRNAYSARDWEWYHRIFQAAEKHGIDLLENLNIPVEPYVSPSVRCYVHVSDYVRRIFAPFDTHNVTVYPGVDLEFFSRELGDDPVPDDCIGMVYRLEKDKLSEASIDVFIEVVRRRPVTKAIIVGGGRFLDFYRRRVQEAGVADAFTFTGYVGYDDLPALYRQMSVFVAPVHRESFGQVSPFAMGMQLPVVGYNVGALEEITGDASLLAPPGDYKALAGTITALLDNRERRLDIGTRNRARAEALFSLKMMIDKYAELYDFMLSEGTGRQDPVHSSLSS